tara:strand:+ start:476 stop:688 length:213 start_codon:yes stop_codon:yes gene_type:complete
MCGYCGQPTDNLGAVISLKAINEMNADWKTAELLHGECCRNQQEYETERRTVTAEMASDAGQPDLEGHLI